MATVRRHQTQQRLGSILRIFVVGAMAAVAVLVHEPVGRGEGDVAPAAYSTERRPVSMGFAPSDLVWADQTEINKTLDYMQAIGSKWIRIPIAWSLIEPVEGTRDWSKVDAIVAGARARDISVLGVIHSTPGWAAVGGQAHAGMPKSVAQFGQFSADVAARYKGKVSSYEIWNEPNGYSSFTPMDPAKYTELLKAAYPRIKAVSSSITVVGGAVVDSWITVDPVRFVKGMYAAGAKGYFDALSFHPYHYYLPFSQGLNQANSPLEQLMAIRTSMLANTDGAKKIWATEYGQPTSVSSEAEQSSMIGDFTRTWASLPYTGPIMIHTLRDRQTGSSDPEATFGVVRSDWTAKASTYQVWSDQVYGVEVSAETQRFEALQDPALGAVVGPVYQVNATTYAQKRENGTLYDPPPPTATPTPTPTPTVGTGYTAPPEVAAKAAQLNTKAVGPFANGYQDFDKPGGLRIFFSQSTGVHAIGGGIVASWTPALGLATSDEVPLSFGTKVTFQNGSITWYPFWPATVTMN